MTKSPTRDRPTTTDLEAKASSSPRASSQAQASLCAGSEAYAACGAALPSHHELAGSSSFKCPCGLGSSIASAGQARLVVHGIDAWVDWDSWPNQRGSIRIDGRLSVVQLEALAFLLKHTTGEAPEALSRKTE